MGTGGFDLVSRVLFPTPESSYTVEDFPEELIFIPKSLNPGTASPEDCVPCLCLLSPSSRFLVLYLHANAEDLGRCYQFCSMLRHQFQVHVLAVEFPGYGICPGGPADDNSVMENVETAFRFVREVLCWPLDGILLLGRSIGTGLALRLAARNEVYGVILVSPFLSVKELCRHVVGPFSYLVQERFPNEEMMPKLRSPLLVVHGKKDLTVPVEHGKELFRLCRSRKRLVCPEDMEHNTNLHTNISYFVLPMLQFFSLPDYCFDELRLPDWCYDKRLSVQTPRIASIGTGICTQGKKSSMDVPDIILRGDDDASKPDSIDRLQQVDSRPSRSIPETPDLQGKSFGARDAAKKMNTPRSMEIRTQAGSGSGLPGDKDPEPPDDWAEMGPLAVGAALATEGKAETLPPAPLPQPLPQPAAFDAGVADQAIVFPDDPSPPAAAAAPVEEEEEEVLPAPDSEDEDEGFTKVPRSSATFPLLGDLGRPLDDGHGAGDVVGPASAGVPHLPVLGHSLDSPVGGPANSDNAGASILSPVATQQVIRKVPRERLADEPPLPAGPDEDTVQARSTVGWESIADGSARPLLTTQKSKEWVV
mmetsp:Transcript_8406/g.18856  ORF Transcript_8406/g.18856 Transcript_8406/m.18856 type:complete len:590 (-) Transcript_8406:72-1841(-)